MAARGKKLHALAQQQRACETTPEHALLSPGAAGARGGSEASRRAQAPAGAAAAAAQAPTATPATAIAVPQPEEQQQDNVSLDVCGCVVSFRCAGLSLFILALRLTSQTPFVRVRKQTHLAWAHSAIAISLGWQHMPLGAAGAPRRPWLANLKTCNLASFYRTKHRASFLNWSRCLRVR